jgi:hypothetical protein
MFSPYLGMAKREYTTEHFSPILVWRKESEYTTEHFSPYLGMANRE